MYNALDDKARGVLTVVNPAAHRQKSPPRLKFFKFRANRRRHAARAASGAGLAPVMKATASDME